MGGPKNHGKTKWKKKEKTNEHSGSHIFGQNDLQVELKYVTLIENVNWIDIYTWRKLKWKNKRCGQSKKDGIFKELFSSSNWKAQSAQIHPNDIKYLPSTEIMASSTQWIKFVWISSNQIVMF